MNFFETLPNTYRGNIQVDPHNAENYHLTYDSSFRGVIARQWPSVIPRKLAPRNLLEERLISFHGGFHMSPNHSFYKLFSEKIERLVDAGIPNYLVTEAMRPRVEQEIRNKSLSGPKVLTMEHLALGFKFSLCPLIIAAIVFIIEMAIPLIKFC